MKDYSFELCIWYIWLYFLEEEIQIFLLGPLVNLYAPLPPGLSGVFLGTNMNIFYSLPGPVKGIKHNVICPPNYFSI